MITLPSDYPQSNDWTSTSPSLPINGINMEYFDSVCVALGDAGRAGHKLLTEEDLISPASDKVGSVAWCDSSQMNWGSAPSASNRFLYWTGSSVVWSELPTFGIIREDAFVLSPIMLINDDEVTIEITQSSGG